MLLTSKGKYGIKAMIDIAQNSIEHPVSIKQIAKRQKLSESYLEQIVSLLKKYGLVISTRGAQGGYYLSAKPSEITVGDMLRALEGTVSPSECVDDLAPKCSNEDACQIRYLLKELKNNIDDMLDNITLFDLINKPNIM